MKNILAVLLFLTIIFNASSQSEGIPEELLREYYSVKKIENSEKKTQIAAEMEKYMNTTVLQDNGFVMNRTGAGNNGNNGNDWYTNDIIACSGNLSEQTQKPLILKQGEDGLLYMLASLKPQFSQKGFLRLSKSSDGGITWNLIIEGASYSEYFFSLDMLVESRNNMIADSTRITIYYTSSPQINGNDARLSFFSTLSNGNAQYSGLVGYPSSGRKFEQVTCCSDGQYYQNSTYLHAIVKESSNAGTTNGFRHFRTINWGQTHTNEMITTESVDNYPGAQFLATTSSDSIYISFERVFDNYSTGFGIYRTTELPSTTRNYVLTPMIENGVKNEKPCLTISQQVTNAQKNMIITFTSRNLPYSYYSTNGGKLWTFKVLSSTKTCAYTYCSSDSSTAAGNNFVLGFVNLGGDSVMTTRISVASTVNSLTKVNNTPSSAVYVPVFGIYHSESGKSSVTAFAGSGGLNAYFDGEGLTTGVSTISGEVPSGYKLEQNYPNPFNPSTNIKFSVPKSGNVKLSVFDITGKLVSVVVNSTLAAGSYSADFDASSLSSGVYFYRIESGEYVSTKKMTLIK